MAAFLLVLFMIFAAFSVDVGFLMLQRTRAQIAVDAAALAGVDNLGLGQEAIDGAVDEYLNANGFDADSSELIDRTIELGEWDHETRTFTSVAEESEANAVRVNVLHTGVDSFFGRFLGASQYTVPAQATASRGENPRDIVMVIDCSTSMGSHMGAGGRRIDNAKAAAQELVNQLVESDRVGLAVFSWRDPNRNRYERTGIMEELLDFDHDPTDTRIGELDKGEYGSGTNIGGGLRAGLDVFLNSDERPPLKPGEELEQILVLLTDGRVNKAEPYPTPDDGATGTLPPPPYDAGFDKRESVTQWANSIKARGIILHVVTLGTNAHDELMVDAATPDDGDRTYYHHIANGDDDVEQLLEVYRGIGAGDRRPHLVQ